MKHPKPLNADALHPLLFASERLPRLVRLAPLLILMFISVALVECRENEQEAPAPAAILSTAKVGPPLPVVETIAKSGMEELCSEDTLDLLTLDAEQKVSNADFVTNDSLVTEPLWKMEVM